MSAETGVTGTMTAPELRLNSITAGYFAHDIVLDDVNMNIEPAKVTVVLGPNGSGKSTALRIMSRFLRPRSGSVTLDGEDICTESRRATSPGHRGAPAGPLGIPRAHGARQPSPRGLAAEG